MMMKINNNIVCDKPTQMRQVIQGHPVHNHQSRYESIFVGGQVGIGLYYMLKC